jgi:hypothetical protein
VSWLLWTRPVLPGRSPAEKGSVACGVAGSLWLVVVALVMAGAAVWSAWIALAVSGVLLGWGARHMAALRVQGPDDGQDRPGRA